MLKISEFASSVGWTVKTLRYYDEIGLLKPDYVDNYSGYRYYTEEQLKDAKIIDLFKSCYFSLDEIKLYMNNLDQRVIEDKINQLEFMKTDIDEKIKLLHSLNRNLANYEDTLSNVKVNPDEKTNDLNVDSVKVKKLLDKSKAA